MTPTVKLPSLIEAMTHDLDVLTQRAERRAKSTRAPQRNNQIRIREIEDNLDRAVGLFSYINDLGILTVEVVDNSEPKTYKIPKITLVNEDNAEYKNDQREQLIAPLTKVLELYNKVLEMDKQLNKEINFPISLNVKFPPVKVVDPETVRVVDLDIDGPPVWEKVDYTSQRKERSQSIGGKIQKGNGFQTRTKRDNEVPSEERGIPAPEVKERSRSLGGGKPGEDARLDFLDHRPFFDESPMPEAQGKGINESPQAQVQDKDSSKPSLGEDPSHPPANKKNQAFFNYETKKHHSKHQRAYSTGDNSDFIFTKQNLVEFKAILEFTQKELQNISSNLMGNLKKSRGMFGITEERKVLSPINQGVFLKNAVQTLLEDLKRVADPGRVRHTETINVEAEEFILRLRDFLASKEIQKIKSPEVKTGLSKLFHTIVEKLKEFFFGKQEKSKKEESAFRTPLQKLEKAVKRLFPIQPEQKNQVEQGMTEEKNKKHTPRR